MSGRVWRVKLKGGNFLVNSFLIVGAGVYKKFDFKSVFRFKYEVGCAGSKWVSLDYDTVSNTKTDFYGSKHGEDVESKFRQVMFSVDAYYKKFFVFDNVGRLIEVDSEFMREGKKERVFYGFYPNGRIKVRKYYVDGVLHREGGPAVIEYYEDGKIKEERYYFKGKCHRTDGPAIICYNPDGSIEEEIFAENDYIKAEDFLKLIRKIK